MTSDWHLQESAVDQPTTCMCLIQAKANSYMTCTSGDVTAWVVRELPQITLEIGSGKYINTYGTSGMHGGRRCEYDQDKPHFLKFLYS